MAVYVTGIASDWSLGVESVFGTAVAPTRALHFIPPETLSLEQQMVTSNATSGGLYQPAASSSRAGTGLISGDITLPLYTDGAAILTKAMLGSLITSGAGPYIHTGTFADLQTWSLQVGIGQTTTAMIKKIAGAAVASWELRYAVNQLVTLGLSWVARSQTIVPRGAALDDLEGTLPSSLQAYSFSNVSALTIEGVAHCISGLTIGCNNSIDTDFYCLGDPLLKAAPAGQRLVTGTLELPLDVSSTVLYDAFVNQTLLTLVATCTSGTDAHTVTAEIRLTSGTPQVNALTRLTQSIPFVGFVPDGGAPSSGFSMVTTNSDSTP